MLFNWICPSFILSCLFIRTVTVPLSAFLILIVSSLLSDLSASRSTGGRLFLGFDLCELEFDLF